MAERKLSIVITGNAKDALGAFKQVESGTDSLTSKIGNIAKVAAAAFTVDKVVTFGKGLYDAAIESQKVSKQTDAVLKSMGDSAGLTSKQIGDLSTKLSLQTGIDDELIQSGENVLLTFRNIHDEVGRGNDVFTRATAVTVDMSKALGTDLKSANIQVGKALNDPIKGITALTRVGVSFTEQQKDQIKALVASGDTLGAQKIILRELESEFKGSAEAQATAGEKLSVAWDNIQEQLGGYLLPVVEKVATFLADNLPAAMAATSDFIDTRLKPAFEAVVSWVRDNWPQIQATIQAVMDNIRSIISADVAIVSALWDTFGVTIMATIQRVWPPIQQIITGVMQTIQGVIKTITALIHGDWGLAWDGIKQIFMGVWNEIVGFARLQLENLRTAVLLAMDAVKAVFSAAWSAAVAVVRAGVTAVLNEVKALPGQITSALAALPKVLYDVGVNMMKGFVNGVVSMAKHLADAALGVVKGAVDGVRHFLHLGSPSRLFNDFGQFTIQGFIEGVEAQSSPLLDRVRSVLAAMSTTWQSGIAGLSGDVSFGAASGDLSAFGLPGVSGTVAVGGGGGGTTVIQLVAAPGGQPLMEWVLNGVAQRSARNGTAFAF